ncbi:MAG: VRR-NUC domain-containing protein [Pseudomonadota bacterium]
MNPLQDKPFYYLENFERALDWIGQRYADLLDGQERAFVDAFPALPRAARALFVRMLMRKGSAFRTSKLTYAEIGCAEAAARALLRTAWVESDPVLDIDTLFTLLSKAEIAQAFGLSAPARAAKKSEQLAALRAQFADPRPFSAWYRASGESVLHVRAKPLCERLRLIFFGNTHQDWSEFVLSDLGVYRYESVPFGPGARAFQNRRDLDDYLALQRVRELAGAGELTPELIAALQSRHYDNAWLAGRRARLLYQLGQQYEQRADWAGAGALYAACNYPGARARAIRVLEKDGQTAKAQALLSEAWGAPENEAERLALRRMAPRLARKLGLVAARAPAAAPPPSWQLSLARPLPALPVEQLVRAHLASAQAPVFYVENALINALFGLLCWPAIFCALPGAFFHPFQRGPADLHSPHFQRERAALFDACLAELDDDRHRHTIARRYRDKQGIQSPFLAWDRLSEELIALALDCIPAAHLKLWFARILQDIQANRSGFPDLIQFWPAERRYRMIEVKGPGDRLQDSQLRAIAFCGAHQMPVAVCYVQWCEAAPRDATSRSFP